MHKIWIEISPSAFLHNQYQIAQKLQPKVVLMAILKSNAYGHGILEVAEILVKNQRKFKNELWLGVDSLTEAKSLSSLRSAKNIPIIVLGYVPNNDLKQISPNTRLTVYNFETIKALKKINKKFKVHIKVETGTQRQGIGVGELPDFIKELKRAKNIEIEGISSHFARTEDLSSPTFTEKQYKIFYDASKLAEKLTEKKLLKHIACSAAINRLPKSHFDMVRAGINLYGLQSINSDFRFQISDFRQLNLKPVLSWKTIVAQVKDVKKSAPVGYGRTAAMPYDGQIAILPVGYWDGYDRRLSNLGEVLIGGKRCKILGRVCMNMCMALLPKDLKIKVEDKVVLIGRQGKEEITVDELARKMDTINYEVITRINPLIPRLVV